MEGAKGNELTDRAKWGNYDEHNDPDIACEDLDPPREEELNYGCDNTLARVISSSLRLNAIRYLAYHNRRIRRKYWAIIASVSLTSIAGERVNTYSRVRWQQLRRHLQNIPQSK